VIRRPCTRRATRDFFCRWDKRQARTAAAAEQNRQEKKGKKNADEHATEATCLPTMNVQCPPTVSTRLVGRIHTAARAVHNSVCVSVQFQDGHSLGQLLSKLRAAAVDTPDTVEALGHATHAVWWLSDGTVAEARRLGENGKGAESGGAVEFERYRMDATCQVTTRLKSSPVEGYYLSQLPRVEVHLGRRTQLRAAAGGENNNGANTQVPGAYAGDAGKISPKFENSPDGKTTLLPFEGSKTLTADPNPHPNPGSAATGDLPPTVVRQYLVHTASFRVRTGVVFELGVSTPVAAELRDAEHAVWDPRRHHMYLVARSSVPTGISANAGTTAVFRNIVGTLHNFLQLFHPKLQVRAE
jgi:hypothetical protein